jgi:hypothetical protein
MSTAATVEISRVEVEPVRVRVLPGGRMDRENAAKYIGRKPKTLAMWALNKKGPPVHKAGGRCFYMQEDLDAFNKGEAA